MDQSKKPSTGSKCKQWSISYPVLSLRKAGKSRIVTIKDEQNVVLKEWKFGDAKDASAKVSCSVKDIVTLPKIKAGKKVNLYYAASELPNGRLLATLTSVNKSAAQP